MSQRERVIRATGRLVVDHGYAALSIPAISGSAGVSNKTFYEHFGSKRDAFLVAFELLADEAFAATSQAIAAAGPQARRRRAGDARVRCRQRALRPAGLLRAADRGPPALDRADAVLDSFTALIDSTPDGGMSAVIREAIGSGIWAVIQGREQSVLTPYFLTVQGLNAVPRSMLPSLKLA